MTGARPARAPWPFRWRDARVPRAWALTALLALGLALAAPAQAQTSEKLVSNSGQGVAAGVSDSTKDRAQAFDTGDNATGYKLTSVKVNMGQGVLTSVVNTLTAQLFLADNTSGHPTGNSLGTFTNPGESTAGLRTFTAPSAGIDLDPNEGYVFVMDTSQSCGSNICAHVKRTTNDTEDMGAASGWSIANNGFQRNANNAGGWSNTGDQSLMLELHGYAKTPRFQTALPSPVRNTALVDNSNEASGGTAFFTADLAQGFTTGGNTGDEYTLTGVDLMLEVGSAQPTISVKIHPSSNLNRPDTGTTLATLTNPASLASGRNTFTAVGGLDLTANTAYFVVIDVGTLTTQSKWLYTQSTAEHVGAAGWSLGDVSFSLSGSSWTQHSAGGGTPSFRMAVHGYARNAVAPGAPAVTTINGGDAASAAGSLTVNWSAPTATGGSGIIDYDLRYFQGTADPTDEADWVEDGEAAGLPGLVTTTSATITGLKANTSYRVQVRAANAAGEGPWSASGDGSTITSTKSGNNAPVVFKQQAANAQNNTCAVDTATLPARPSPAQNSPAATSVRGDLTVAPQQAAFPSACSNGTSDPIFHDTNGDALSFSVDVTLPANVRSLHEPGQAAYPRVVHSPSGIVRHRLWNRAVAAGGATNVVATVTATDPHGAARSITYTFSVGTFNNTVGAPVFDEAVGLLNFAQGAAVRTVLPSASGGDTQNGSIPYYLYTVAGLPPGLSFDSRTRTVSGRPTTAGTWTVTYTADDYDGNYSRATGSGRPDADDLADAVTQTFTVRVGPSATAKPVIDLVRIVSLPTHDADGDGVFDTYVEGDMILVDVEYSEPVRITGGNPGTGGSNLRLALHLDVGTDDNDLSNSDKRAFLHSLRNGGRTLRFGYKVLDDAEDTDGIWVQTASGDKLVLDVSGGNLATIASAETGVLAERTKTGLPTTGDAGHKVNGGVAAATGPVPRSATVNGNTLTVIFTKPLNTAVNTTDLIFRLDVHGAGDVSGGNRNAYQHPERVAVSNETIDGASRGKLVLTLSPESRDTWARAGQRVTLGYAGGGLLKGTDSASSPVPGFRELPVTNDTPGSTGAETDSTVAGPVPVRASAAGNTVKVTFDRNLDETSKPAGSAFTLFTGDNNLDHRTLRGTGTASISGDTVTVRLDKALHADESAGVSYAQPAAGRLKDALDHTEAASFSGFRVETTDDVTGPELVSWKLVEVTSSFLRLALYFDEELDTTSVPADGASGDFAVTLNGASRPPTGGVTVKNNAVFFRITSITNLPITATFGIKYPRDGTTPDNPIRDLAGNAAPKFDKSGNVSSEGKPGLSLKNTEKPTVDGARLRLIFSLSLHPGEVPGPSAFALAYPLASGQLAADRVTFPSSVTAVTVEGNDAVLHLANPVHPCDGQTPLTVRYTKPTTGSKLTGLDAKTTSQVDSFSHESVTNKRHSQCGKNWVAGMLQGSVVIRAKRPFATDVPPQPAWFTVTASGGPVTVTGASFDPNDPKVLKLTLSREFAPGETVTASYRRPQGEHGLWDTNGNQLGDVTDWPVRATAPAEPGLTAAFHGLPEGHDGRRLFAFELRFSEEFQGLRLTALKAGALAVTGGRLIDVKRTVRSQNRRVTVRVRPATTGTLTLALAATEDCTAAAAICTKAGKKFSTPVSVTVPGPDTPATPPAVALPGLGVAAARADEGGTLEFAVTLDAAATSAVTVDYATADGTATAGADYTAVSGTLTFAAGETSKTVAVAALADTEAEGDETLTLTLSNAAGATLGTAAATGTVADVAPLTAAFHGLPAEHDGKKLFGFEIRFSEEFQGLRLGAFKAGALAVTGGRLVDVKRTTRGQNRSVTVRVRPASYEALTLTLAAPTDCAAASAICAADGRMLATAVSATVRGPVRLSVADAEAREGEDAAVTFPVTLSRAAAGPVTVDYRTRDGSATAGEDYTATRGSLTFRAGETQQTIAVPLLDDLIDDDGETFTLTLTNAAGAAIDDGTATGTIRNSDAIPQAWLSRFGRTVGMHVTDAITDRLRAGPAASSLTIGGQPVPLSKTTLSPGGNRHAQYSLAPGGNRHAQNSLSPGGRGQGEGGLGEGETGAGGYQSSTPSPQSSPIKGEEGASEHGHAQYSLAPGGRGQGEGETGEGDQSSSALLQSLAGLLGLGPGANAGQPGAPGHDPRLNAGQSLAPMNLRQVLLGSAFRLNLNAADAGATTPRLTAWGRVTGTQFDGQERMLTLDGDVLTGTVGLDGAWDRLLLGVAVAHSRGNGAFAGTGNMTGQGGTLDNTLTSLHPYLRYAVTDRLDVWGTVGYGWGDLTVAQTGSTARETAMNLLTGSVGTRGVLLSPAQSGGYQLATRADALFTRTSSDAVAGMAETDADAHRLRLLLEGSRGFSWANGRTLTPALELGLRHDWGDAETGFGLEVGGRLQYADPALGLTVDATVRGLLAHEDAAYREWGASGTVRLAPGAQGRGLSLTLAPSWGAAASGVEGLWARPTAAGLAPTGQPQAQTGRLTAEVGYGVALGHAGLLTPYAGTGLAEGAARTYRLGTRWQMTSRRFMNLTLNLEGTRQESAGAQPVNQGVQVQVGWTF